MKNIRFTKKGFEALKIAYEDLKNSRPSAVADLKRAREMGDLSENGYYKAARAKLSEIDRNLRKFLIELRSADVVKESDRHQVGIGRTVKLSDGKKETVFQIVGDLEADPTQKKISLLSPLGQALERKKIGDKAEIITPSGKIHYKITKIS
ncbi:MAG: GreA/GreB family elongation factor [Patescibacteria group bacterium]|mgnify:FL=1